MNFLKRYYPELLVFGVIFGILLTCNNPDFTWINTDSDGIHYTYAAEWMYPSHHMSSPLYLILGRLFLFIPYGTVAWKMGLIGVISSVIACIFIYLVIRKYINNRWFALLGAGIYGTSVLVISQSTIVDTYAFVTTLCIGAYYFAKIGKWKLSAVMLGLCLSTHLLAILVIIPMLIAYRELRPGIKRWNFKNWIPIIIMAGFILFYLYVPITNRPPYMWQPDPKQGNFIQGYFSDTLDVVLMLVGGISIWDIPKRIIDTIGILSTGLGVAIIACVMYFVSQKKKMLRNILFWLTVLPIVLFIGNLSPQTYVYMILGLPFGIIGGMIWLYGYVNNHRRTGYTLAYCTLASVIGFGIFNANYMDIGRTLDPKLSASEFYYNEIGKVPDGQVLIPNNDWEWAAIFRYNKEFGRDIIPVCIGVLRSERYQNDLKSRGIKLVVNEKDNPGIKPINIAKSIVELNKDIGVWTSVTTDAETYESKVIPTNGDSRLIKTLANNGEVIPTWSWKPSNPYDFITGSIEVKEWGWVIYSNYNLLMMVMLACIGMVPAWILWQVIVKRKKWSLNKSKESIK